MQGNASTVPIETLVRASKANARAPLERMLGKPVDKTHVLMEWLMVFAADVMNLHHRRGDLGKSAYEQVTQHKPHHAVAGFGEQVMYRIATDKTDRDKFDACHETGFGTFVGCVTRATECLVICKDGHVYKTRNVRRLTSDRSYGPDSLNYIKVGYRDCIK